MKKTSFLLALVCILSGCSIFRPPALLVSYALDYSEYEKEGFFLSESNSVSFIYKPIASVNALQLSGYKVKNVSNKEYRDDSFQTGHLQSVTKNTNQYVTASRTEVLKQLVQEAKDKGANAIINLEIESLVGVTKEGYSYLSGYSAKGMAIKK